MQNENVGKIRGKLVVPPRENTWGNSVAIKSGQFFSTKFSTAETHAQMRVGRGYFQEVAGSVVGYR